MKRLAILTIIIMACAIFSMGMELGGSGGENFPKPKLNYKAAITDIEGMVHKAEFISLNGKTSITGQKGKANITINFRKIQSAVFSKTESKSWVMAHFILRSGKKVDIKVKGLSRCYGITDLGKMSVRIRDIKAIVFDKELPKIKD